MVYNTNITTPIRRSQRIAEVSAKKENELEKYNDSEYESTKKNSPKRYTCLQMSVMIADLTMALVNLALILRRVHC
jgi:hypothetical protein